MYSTEFMRRLPEHPEKPILYVVYSDALIDVTRTLLIDVHNEQYVDKFIEIVAYQSQASANYLYTHDVYIDPAVYLYKNSWNQ